MIRKSILAVGTSTIARQLAGSGLSRPMVRRFVAGETAADGLAAAREAAGWGAVAALDLLGEGVTEEAAADSAAAEYAALIRSVAEAGLDATVSLKLSQLGLMIDARGCRQRLQHLRDLGDRRGVGLEVDMEQSDLCEATLDCCLSTRGEAPVRLALQAYLHRTPGDLDRLAGTARVRLVKGAYAETAAVAAQRAAEIDQRYSGLARRLLSDTSLPAFGTHDGALIADVRSAARAVDLPAGAYEFQMLYGIRRDLQRSLVGDGERVRIYIPFGDAWYPYLMRRIAERPANLRFFLRSLGGD